MVEGGLSAAAGGLAVAAGNLTLLNNLFARRWAERHSLRRVLGATFLAAAALTLAAGLLSRGAPAAAGIAMVAGAFFVAIIDGLGPVPFLRAVRVHERAEMTAVYRTYLDASELLPPLAYFFLFMARRLRRGLRGAGAAPRRRRRPHPAPPAARHVTRRALAHDAAAHSPASSPSSCPVVPKRGIVERDLVEEGVEVPHLRRRRSPSARLGVELHASASGGADLAG